MKLFAALALVTPVACDAWMPRAHARPVYKYRAAAVEVSGGGDAGPRPGPAGVYDAAVALGAGKAATPIAKLIPLSFLSGAHIALGAMLAVSVGGSVPGIKAANPGVQRLLLGVMGLPMGLLMVLGAGGELVTGNMAVCTAAYAAGKATLSNLLRNLGVVYLGNLAGSLFVAYMGAMAKTGISASAMGVASAKVAAPFGVAFARGVLCNWLVCMAVWMATSQKELVSKAAAVLFPISGFVAMGLEHSVANMFFLPFGMFQGAEISVGKAITANLIPVTLGNLVGGAVFVALAYHSAYGN
mmetsp:Transcript_22343/g.70003  ORF Transcript_22343/g.70003 Transcript_22343/m.70003 type:complete len:299 (-) Transcript_22343:95-991(-)